MLTLGQTFRPRAAAKAIASGPNILQYIRDTALRRPRTAHPLTVRSLRCGSVTKGCEVATAKAAEARAPGGGIAGESGANDTFRRRLLEAMAESVAVNGYSNTTVADIVRIARMSRRTFYEYFPDREACFVALLTDNNDELIRAVTAAVDPKALWDAQVRQAVEAWVAAAQSRPAFMQAWIRDAPGLGAEAQRLHTSSCKLSSTWSKRYPSPQASGRCLGSGPSCCLVDCINSPT
jgi:hypothetical protein